MMKANNVHNSFHIDLRQSRKEDMAYNMIRKRII